MLRLHIGYVPTLGTFVEMTMNEEVFNQQIRKFLKKVGITSQREIEKAVRERIASGQLSGADPLQARMTLHVPELDLTIEIDEEIALE